MRTPAKPKKGHEVTARPTSKAKAEAEREGRKVLWRDQRGSWHAATNLLNTPRWAKEVIEVTPATPQERARYDAFMATKKDEANV